MQLHRLFQTICTHRPVKDIAEAMTSLFPFIDLSLMLHMLFLFWTD